MNDRGAAEEALGPPPPIPRVYARVLRRNSGHIADAERSARESGGPAFSDYKKRPPAEDYQWTPGKPAELRRPGWDSKQKADGVHEVVLTDAVARASQPFPPLAGSQTSKATLTATSQHIEKTGGPETIRTSGLCLRRATLYPAELRVPRHSHNPARFPRQAFNRACCAMTPRLGRRPTGAKRPAR